MGLGEGTGQRNRGPAPVKDVRTPDGSPIGTTHQHGSDKTPMERALDAIDAAKDPKNGKKDKSNLPG